MQQTIKSVLCTMLAVITPALADSAITANWQNPQLDQGSVTITVDAAGIVQIDYNVKADQIVMLGNRPRFMKEVDLLFTQAVTLDKDSQRLVFASRGLLLDSKDRAYSITLRPIISDEKGEIFYFLPQGGANLNRDLWGWNSFRTAGFYAGEAGAASHDVYSVGGTEGNSWPDGQLQLLGMRLQVADNAREDSTLADLEQCKFRTGTVYLKDLAEQGEMLPFELPYAYATAFLKEKGDYNFAYQIFTDFQGIPVREQSIALSFDPDNQQSASQKLIFPLGTDGYYWINYQITDSTGKHIAGDFLKTQVFNNPDTTQLSPVAVTAPPSLGFIRINPLQNTNGVYATGAALQVQVRTFAKGNKELSLKYRLTPYYFNDVIDSGQHQLVFATDDNYQDIMLNLQNSPHYNAYRLYLDIVIADQVVQSQLYFLGNKSDLTVEQRRDGELTNRHELKKQPYHRLTYLPSFEVKPGTGDYQSSLEHFRHYLQQTSAFIQHHTFMMALNDFEILPGVYDFSTLDAIFTIAADNGCKITVRFAHGDRHNGPYRWGKFSRQISAEGAVIEMLSYGAYEVTDPHLGKMWLDAYQAIYNRYKQHTAFEGYYIMLPAGEWVVVDQPWAGLVAGYSEVNSESFRRYLREQRGFDLATINRRWGTDYQSFDDIVPPRPLFKLGQQPDLRLSWLDFCTYKAQLAAGYWIATSINSIRAYDNDRVTIAYGTPSSYPHLYGKLDYGHNGGNHSLDRVGEYVDAWENGQIGYITEPINPHGWAAHNDPGRHGWVLDVSIMTMIAQAGGGGANLHVYYFPQPASMINHQGGFYALDRFQRYMPLLRELQAAKIVVNPAQIAVHQERLTLYAKHRTTFSARLGDLRRWFELIRQDGLNSAELSAFDDSSFKLIIPNILDEVISKETFDRYNKLVRDGAKMLIAANTGKYVPEQGLQPFQLLTALGITPPVNDYVTTGNVKAKSTGANLLFSAEREIDFQTVTTLREQSTDPDIVSRFWRYSYRWIPQTNYFGYYPGHQPGGEILARFTDGGAAVSRHQVGKGEVIVFWGTPDMSWNKLDGLMLKAAQWAGVEEKNAGIEVPVFVELTNAELKRHYGLFYQEDKFGDYQIRFPNCPDGDYFADEMVSDMRIGHYSGKELRETGIKLHWQKGYSPLKAVRLIQARQANKIWLDYYNR